MTSPDFQRSKRALRIVRVSDALGLQRPLDAHSHRDRLIELLYRESIEEGLKFSGLSEDRVDIVVSLALYELAESPEDALSVTLLCVRVLARDGQFARIGQLVGRLFYLSEQVRVSRPFLAIAVRAFAEAVQGKRSYAERLLSSALGLSGPSRALKAAPTALHDIVSAVALRRWLADGSLGVLRQALELAKRSGDGFMLSELDAFLTFAAAADQANVAKVVTSYDATFNDYRLLDYLGNLKIKTLFPAQIEALKAGVTLDENRVVALPTSSGKTFIAQLRIAATLTRNRGAKAIYVAPYRLLAHQVEREMTQGLRNLGLVIKDVGSGFDPTFSTGLEADEPDIIVCTPEKLDSLLRLAASEQTGAPEMSKFLDKCTLLIFDEIHLVGRPGRGPRFELLIARLRNRYPQWKLLGLCAATQGAEALSKWVSDTEPLTEGRRPTGTIELAWETTGRLSQRVGSRRGAVGQLPRSSSASEDAARLVLTMTDDLRPVLVIATSRPNAEGIARRIVEKDPAQARRWRESLQEEHRQEVDLLVQEVNVLLGSDHKLGIYIAQGVAYHHAGVPPHLLRRIEALAHKQVLRTLCATTTVAEGSDLPFRAVVIPMLNFPGPSGKLERDLYYNIIGRAGRANVSMEGMVFILESKAKTLHDLVPRSLWSNAQADGVSSRLTEVTPTPTSLEEWELFNDVKSNVLAWLAEGGAGLERQPDILTSLSLAGSTGSSREVENVRFLFSGALASLERDGLARSASPYRLTRLGDLSRLGGLSAVSTKRLSDSLQGSYGTWVEELIGVKEIKQAQAEMLATLLFESVEVMQHSLWLRKISPNDPGRWDILRTMIAGRRDWPYQEDNYRHDVDILAAWISGLSYIDIASRAPEYKSANSLFGGSDLGKRTSDAAEYVGRLSYPASWAWSAARMILQSLGEQLPSFIRRSVELGVPSESSCFLISRLGVTRPGAMSASSQGGSSVAEVLTWVNEVSDEEMLAGGVPAADVIRIAGIRGSGDLASD